MLKNSLKKSLLSLSIGTILALSTATTVLAGPSLFRGDFLSVHNDVAGGTDWSDSVNANPGDIVEFRVIVRNEGDMTVDHAQVIGSINETTALQIPFTATIQAPYGGGTQISDGATVNITGSIPQSFRYEPGHARLFGVTNLFNCPSGCGISDAVVAGGGMEVGDIPAGGSVQVLFKARLSNLVSPTPTPTPTPTPGPTATPTPTPAPAAAQGGTTNNNCTGSNSCSGTATANANANVNITNPAPAQTAVAGVTTLPKTGPSPLALLGLGGVVAAGWKLRRYGQPVLDTIYQPISIWRKRSIDKA